MPGQEDEGVLWTQQSTGFRSGKPMVAGTPCFLPLLSACVTHINGNNFFQLLAEPAPRGAFLSLAPRFILFWLQRVVHPYSHSFASPSGRRQGSCLFNSCVLVSSLICYPESPVPVLLCDRNVLVNCVTNLLCVCVCLWGWFILFAGP
uniref:Uncharacterized protein n=1 Tax=Rhinopithecus bieti TaxID=61621 RepID=A0A2K6M9B4_RHIBE